MTVFVALVYLDFVEFDHVAVFSSRELADAYAQQQLRRRPSRRCDIEAQTLDKEGK